MLASRAGPIIVATPAKPSSTPASLRGFIRSSAVKQVGDDHAPDRGRRVEDRGEPAGDMRLAPAEQSEGQGIVEQSQQQDRSPRRARQAERLALAMRNSPHRDRGDGQPQPDIGQRLRRARTATPMNRKAPPQITASVTQDRPVAAVHDGADHRRAIDVGRAGARPRIAVKLGWLRSASWLRRLVPMRRVPANKCPVSGR